MFIDLNQKTSALAKTDARDRAGNAEMSRTAA
jgi:hypothetical protein